MKTSNMYLNRLLRLARHLGKNHLNEVLYKKTTKYTCNKAGCNIEHFDWALAALAKTDSQKWNYNDDGQLYFVSHGQLNALTSAAIYFNLTADELFHLFVPGYQEPIYKGISLGDNATPSDVANNIYQFISLKETEETTQVMNIRIRNVKEKKVIKKFKLKNVA